MQLPQRDDWVRIGYTALGGGGAILWNKYLPLANRGGGYLPPAALAAFVLFSEDAGDVEKDVAAGILGYLLSAQAISFATPPAGDPETAALYQVRNPAAPQGGLSGLDAEAAKLQKIREVTGTLGAIADIVGKFRGNG
jgi:hypothetical protein